MTLLLQIVRCFPKAAEYIKLTSIVCALVSTNSICQGESVGILWRYLFDKKNIEIIFAYQSFKWASESNDAAAVACVIIGIAEKSNRQNNKMLYLSNGQIVVSNHINGYLFDGDDTYIKARGTPYNKLLPKMTKGNKPVDGRALLVSQEEYLSFIKKYPDKKHLLRNCA